MMDTFFFFFFLYLLRVSKIFLLQKTIFPEGELEENRNIERETLNFSTDIKRLAFLVLSFFLRVSEQDYDERVASMPGIDIDHAVPKGTRSRNAESRAWALSDVISGE